MVNSDSHNIWLNIADSVNSEFKSRGLECDIWINDLGYMEIVNPDNENFVKVYVEGDKVYADLGEWNHIIQGNLEQATDRPSISLARVIVKNSMKYLSSRSDESYSMAQESRTADVWKEIVNKIKKDARSRKIIIADSTLNKLTLADKKDPEKKVDLMVDLMNSGAGECIVKLGKKTWKMGDTLIPNRRGGGTKKPDMDAQVENILDMVEFTLSEMKKDTNEAVDMDRPLWEGRTANDYVKDNLMIMDMIMSGRSNTYRTDRIPKTKAELKQAIKDNCTPNVPKLQNAVVDYFCKRYGIR